VAKARREPRAAEERRPQPDGEHAGAGLAPPAEPADGQADLEKRLAEAEAERDEYLAQLQRVAADFENYRKRATRDQESLVARAHERLVKELLPVLDDLERALQAAADHEEAKLEEGVRLVERELRDALDREGLVEIETNGRFDPHVHEALVSQASEQEEGAVLEVLQKGYRLGDRVLRPARVVVSQGSAQEPQEA
jgi:molecular chaperone GrpE